MKRRHKTKPRVARGYGAPYMRLRAAWVRKVNAGGVCCWRCGYEIVPGSKWHLGHDDDDRTVIRGPEHPRCNLRAAAAKTNEIKRSKRAPLVTSRAW